MPNIVDPPENNPAEGVPVVGPAVDYLDDRRQDFQQGVQTLLNTEANGLDNTLTSNDISSAILSSEIATRRDIRAHNWLAVSFPQGFESYTVSSYDNRVGMFTIQDGQVVWVKQVTPEGVTVLPYEVYYFITAEDSHKPSNADGTILIVGNNPKTYETQEIDDAAKTALLWDQE